LCVGKFHKIDMQSEDNGLSIIKYNNRINELTGLYWIWKNDNNPYVGLSHYRRYFNNNGMRLEKLDAQKIMQNYDIIASYHSLGWSVHENIIKTVGTTVDTIAYNEFIKVINKYQPQYLDSFQ